MNIFARETKETEELNAKLREKKLHRDEVSEKQSGLSDLKKSVKHISRLCNLLNLIYLGKRLWKARKPSPGKTSIIMCLGRMVQFAFCMMSVVTSSQGPWPHSWGLAVLVIRTLFRWFFKFVLMIIRKNNLPWRPSTEEEYRCCQRRCFSTRSTSGFWLCSRDCLWYVICLASTLPF